MYVTLPAQVQVLSAALKAAQLDSPTDGTKSQEDQQSESDCDTPSTESKPMEVQSESDESTSEEEQTMETMELLSQLETNPVQEQGDEETQTEPFDDHDDSPPDSPVLVGNDHKNLVLGYVWSTFGQMLIF